jgi:hypothetical protein
LHPKLTRLQRSNRLAAVLGAAPYRVNSNMQKHGQSWMQINSYDDQVDSLSQFLTWIEERKRNRIIMTELWL